LDTKVAYLGFNKYKIKIQPLHPISSSLYLTSSNSFRCQCLQISLVSEWEKLKSFGTTSFGEFKARWIIRRSLFRNRDSAFTCISIFKHCSSLQIEATVAVRGKKVRLLSLSVLRKAFPKNASERRVLVCSDRGIAGGLMEKVPFCAPVFAIPWSSWFGVVARARYPDFVLAFDSPLLFSRWTLLLHEFMICFFFVFVFLFNFSSMLF